MTVVTTPLFAFYAVKLFSGIAVDPAKLYAEHAAMLAALREGDTEEVRRMFVEMTDSAPRHSIEGLRYIETQLEQAIPERYRCTPKRPRASILRRRDRTP